jgi:hypothetical protein
MEILGDFISEPSVSPHAKKAARVATKRWATEFGDEIRARFEKSKKDPSLDPFVRWHVEFEWPYHIGRLGSLVDPQFENEVRSVLEWSKRDLKDVRSWGSDLKVVKLWSEGYKRSGELPPQVLVDGYLVSSLIRGRYYQEIAGSGGGEFIWSPLRDYALRPVVALTQFHDFKKDLTRLVLVGVICRGAMEESSELDAIVSWAENIRRFKKQPVEILPEDDQEKAIKNAVDIARRCGFQFQWPKLETALQGTMEYLLSPLVGFAGGLFALATLGSHPLSFAYHAGSEWIARPFIEDVAAKIYLAATESNFRLERIARSAAQRLFAFQKKDLPGG